VTDGGRATAAPGRADWLSVPAAGVTLDGVVFGGGGSVLEQLHSRVRVTAAARANRVALD